MGVWGWPQWVALVMGWGMQLLWLLMIFGKKDHDYVIGLLWTGFWLWVLWMGGFWG